MLVVLRRPPVHAAIAGTLLVMVLWLAGAADAWVLGSMVAAAQDTAVLFASTAFVIVPGLVFVIFIERMGVNLALSQWVRSLGLGRGDQVVFIVLGLAPLLEAMTGFGVSLIATVPLLLSLFERRVALRIALTGMAIMPWGNAGLGICHWCFVGSPGRTRAGIDAGTDQRTGFLGPQCNRALSCRRS